MKNLIIFSLLVLFTVPAAAQSYKLRYNFTEGKTYLYRDNSENLIIQEMMGSEMKITNNFRSVVRLVTETNNPENITFIVSLDSAVSETKMPMKDTTMVLTAVLGKQMKMTISKNGELISKQMIDTVDLNNQMTQIGQKETMQLPELPENEVKTGEKWKINKTDTLDMMGGKTVLFSEMEFTLSGKEDMMGYTVLKIPYTAKLKIEGKGKMMGYEFFLEGGGDAKGDYYFNPDEGIPVYSEAVQTFDITMAASGDQNMIIPISQTMKTTRTLVK